MLDIQSICVGIFERSYRPFTDCMLMSQSFMEIFSRELHEPGEMKKGKKLSGLSATSLDCPGEYFGLEFRQWLTGSRNWFCFSEI